MDGAIVHAGGLSANTWHLLIGVHDSVNDLIKARRDNAAWSSLAYSSGIDPAGNAFRVGGPGGSDPTDIRCGPVMLWNRVLSEGECLRLWNDGAGLALA